MNPLFPFMWVLIIHFIGDFVCQSRWMGNNKSKNAEAMFAHIGSYMGVLLVGMLPFISIYNPFWVIIWIITNGIAHLMTDGITSTFSGDFYRQGKEYAFWTTIGADQLIHTLTLALTFSLLKAT